MDGRAERESVNKMYLHPEGLWARCERQERIALSSAVNIEAESLRRLAVTNPLAEYVYPVLELDFEPSVIQMLRLGYSAMISKMSLLYILLSDLQYV